MAEIRTPIPRGGHIGVTRPEFSSSGDQKIGVGTAATVYFIGDGARINPPSALDVWALEPVGQDLSDAFGGPVWIENDGTAAAIGEAMFAVGRELDSFAYLYFSAGFGGVVVRGEPCVETTAIQASAPRSFPPTGFNPTSPSSTG